MVDIRSAYYNFCISKNINFRNETSVASYDDTTLFCPAGMQQFKTKFNDKEYKGTIANIQPCIRLNDINEIGDGTHLLYFNMIGLFSFRELTVKDAIDFWMSFLIEINAKPDTITIHPDKFKTDHALDSAFDFVDDVHVFGVDELTLGKAALLT